MSALPSEGSSGISEKAASRKKKPNSLIPDSKHNKAEATFTKAKLDYDDGREEYEFEFYANGMEYDVDVDANTGRVVKFEVERNGRDYCDFDYDDRYDYDDWYDFD